MWAKTRSKLNLLGGNRSLSEANGANDSGVSLNACTDIDCHSSHASHASLTNDFEVKKREDKSIALASKGCEIALKSEDFVAAVRLLSRAIKINDTDFRYFANRSLAFYSMKKYELALSDAERAIQLNHSSPVCLARKAMALSALHRFAEAELAAKRALKLDPNSNAARYELLEARRLAFMRSGFDYSEVKPMVGKCKSIADGIERLKRAARQRGC